MHLRPIVPAVLLILSACATAPAQPPQRTSVPAPVNAQGACNVAGLEAAAGQKASPQHVQELTARSGALRTRVHRPGMVMTMDFRLDRLTVYVDEDNRIVKLACN